MGLLGVNAACAGRPVEDVTVRAGAWTQVLGDPSRAPSAGETVGADLAPWWRTEIGRAASGAPAIGDTVVALQAVDGRVALLHWETGRPIWERELKGPGAGSALIVQSRVYAATTDREGRVYALDVRRGRTIWEQTLGPVAGSPAAAGRVVIVTVAPNRVVALLATDGTEAWSVRVRGRLRTGVAIVGERVVAGTDDSLYVFDLAEGTRLAAAAGAGALVVPPAATGDLLVAASPDGRVTGIDAATLEQRWTVTVGSPVFGNPAIARDTVFVATLDADLWRIPLAHPASARATPLARGAVRAGAAPVRNGVLVGTISGTIMVARDAVLDGPQLHVAGPLEFPPIMHRGALLVVDGRGKVQTWR